MTANTDTSRPLILISNDDSIAAPGLMRLAETAARFGEVWIVAPAQPQSGQSCAFTVDKPLHINRCPTEGFPNRFTVSGTPVDCIKLALHTIVPRRPDIVLSGINHGSNAGNNSIYSGTMGAVFEACMQGIPAAGFSLLHHSLSADFTETLPFIADIIRQLLAEGLPERVCLNVNFPAKVKIEGIRTVRAARSFWTEEYQEYLTPGGKPFYWLTGRLTDLEPGNPETDLYWLARNYATIVPVTPDQTAPGYPKTSI